MITESDINSYTYFVHTGNLWFILNDSKLRLINTRSGETIEFVDMHSLIALLEGAMFEKYIPRVRKLYKD
jgi:hypothetical protein